MGSTREANKARTRRALADAAMALFTEHGYDHVTMADVAEAAGVSRRTAFRYFATKDELVGEYAMSWLTVFDDAVAAAATAPLGRRLRDGAMAVAIHIERDPIPVRRVFALADAHPAVAARAATVGRLWVDRVAAEIEPGPSADPGDVVRARMLAGALMGMIDAMCLLWAETDQPMVPLLEDGFTVLAPLFEIRPR